MTSESISPAPACSFQAPEQMAARLTSASRIQGRAMRASKKGSSTLPPFAVTLNLPSRGAIRASVVGSAV